MRVHLINYTLSAAQMLIFTKRTRLNMDEQSYEEIKKMTPEEIDKELEYMSNTIPSSWEFCDYSFLISGVSRAFTHQFVRNRHGSYAQQSMRVTDQSNFDTVVPQSVSDLKQAKIVWDAVCETIKKGYADLIKLGIKPEDARGILPTNIETNIVAKFNLRTLSELAKTRTGGRTQAEYQQVLKLMCDQVLGVHPWAEKFLFPKGRNHFDEIEALIKSGIGETNRQDALKVIDKMRKS